MTITTVHAAAHIHQPYIALGKNAKAISNSPYTEYYADRDGAYTIESLVAKPPLFSPTQSQRKLAATKIHWYKIPLKNKGALDYKGVVTSGVANPLALKAYWVNDQHTLTPLPFAEFSRYASHTHNNIPISLKPFERGHLYIEYQSLAHFPLNIHIFPEAEYIDRSFKFTLINGGILGALSVFLLFFLLHFFLHRHVHIGFYCLFILSLLLFMMQIFGYGIRTFWPANTLLNSQFTAFFAGCIYVFYVLFSAYLFAHKAVVRHALLFLSAVIGSISLMGFIVDTTVLLTAIVAVSMPLTIISAATALGRERPTAILFIIGSGLHYILTGLLLVRLMGLQLPWDGFALAALGQLIDIVCLSAAVLLHSRNTERMLQGQMQQRLLDMEALAISERQGYQLRQLNKEAILNSATTAHDVLQVLSSIRLQLATQKIPDPATHLLEKTLIYAGDLLSNRIKTGKMDYTHLNRQQNIRTLLTELAERYQLIYPNLKFRLQDQEIMCSQLVINRIVENLLSNALKYTAGANILLTGRKRKTGYWLQVWDQGGGIPAETLQILFEPFTQLQKNHIDNSSFGLGLYIVRFLCEDCGYLFSVRSRIGRGTCFTITINNYAS